MSTPVGVQPPSSPSAAELNRVESEYRRAGVVPRAVTAVWATVMLGLVAHMLAVLATGGYSYRLSGITIGGTSATVPVLLLSILTVARRLVVCWQPIRAGGAAPAALLFWIILFAYLINGGTQWAGDTLPLRYLPLSILREGNFDLDEFPFLYSRDHFPWPQDWDAVTNSGAELPGYVVRVRGRYVSAYPVGGVLLVLPFYAVSAVSQVNADSALFEELEKLTAAVLVALSAVLLYAALRRVTTSGMALAITVAYAFGTSSFSVSSQALWQHGPSQLALTATLYCLIRGRAEDAWVARAGLPLALAVISRPTDVLMAVVIGGYVGHQHRRQLAGFVLHGLPLALGQIGYNWAYFGNLLGNPQYGMESHFWSTSLANGLAGILLSPSRGLFIYSPVLVFSIAGLAMAWQRRGNVLLRYLGVGVTMTLLLYGTWEDWWGGGSYGPRLLADLTPVLALGVYPLRDVLVRRPLAGGLFAIVLAMSIYAHAVGAIVGDGGWNSRTNFRRHPERLWSWRDNPLVNAPRQIRWMVYRATGI